MMNKRFIPLNGKKLFRSAAAALLFFLFVQGCRIAHDDLLTDGARIQKQLMQSLTMPADTTQKKLHLQNAERFQLHFVQLDSVTLGKKKYYYALIEYDNPLLNRFVVYDTLGNIKLLDKSLDGYLSTQLIATDGIALVALTEKFISVDSVKLERTNIYAFKRDTVVKSLRIFTSYDDKKVILSQNITSYENFILAASFNANKPKIFELTSISYTFDTAKCVFTPDRSLFDDQVHDRIEKRKLPENTQLIHNLATAQEALKLPELPAAAAVPDSKSKVTLQLPAGWNSQKDIFVTTNLRKPLKGDLYFNEVQGAKIWVSRLSENETAEEYASTSLDLINPANPNIRNSEKVLLNRVYYCYYEIRCPRNKYLVVFQIPYNIYQKYEADFNKIMKSIGIECL